MAPTGHSGTHIEQSMQPSGSMARKLGPSTKQSIGQTLTQSVYLQAMQESVTTKGMSRNALGRGEDVNRRSSPWFACRPTTAANSSTGTGSMLPDRLD